MAKQKKAKSLKSFINNITGVTSNMNGANNRHMIFDRNGRQRIGNRRDKYREIRAAFGLSTG